MKWLAILLLLIGLSNEGFANNTLYVIPQPVPIIQQQVVVQTMVYQAPQLIITVPVPIIVYPQPIVDQRIYWGYPYYTTTPMPVIRHKHRCWSY